MLELAETPEQDGGYFEPWIDEVDFEIPKFSRGVIDKAGDTVAQEGGDPF